jgi:hypothetical protein
MFTYLSRRRTQLATTARLRRITAALAAAALGVLAWAAAVPAASARMIPADDDYVPARVTAGPTVRVITAGGMPGWQITVIAVAAALAAAAAAVFLDRTRASRRPAASAG